MIFALNVVTHSIIRISLWNFRNTLTYALYTNHEVNVMEMLIVMVNGVFRGTAPRVNDSSISHLIHTSISFPTLISFIPLFFYFIHLYFTIFCFISFPSASFRLHFASFRLHFASFRIISLHFAPFRFISYFSRTPFFLICYIENWNYTLFRKYKLDKKIS